MNNSIDVALAGKNTSATSTNIKAANEGINVQRLNQPLLGVHLKTQYSRHMMPQKVTMKSLRVNKAENICRKKVMLLLN
jgi:hypothetical protein